ncbi:LEA type 2 family protein [Proteiniphilum acetatigenes]|uniref:NDR1/HIN1-like protein n=1 Tax=Proteiniphilum acetatigenes TaxID=294710 RepID=UPI000373ED36|nr:LEA type 2 family protein [Proteiniphilum acetatigenes]SFK65990.1 Late embryogenesis abundant protein [Porphyromonadaceae bacterium KH3CP3RA]
MKKMILLLSVALLFNGCDVVNKIGGAYQLSQSEYRYRSLDNIQLAGINLGNASAISVSKLASIATALAGVSTMQNIPFSMTLNMDVTNPNKNAAFLDALDYAIQINEMEFVEGKMDIPIRIEPGETKVVPIPISVDLRNVMNRYSQQRVANEMSAFLGITPNETSVTVKLWPKLTVGNTVLKSPAAIPVVFNFGGKDNGSGKN